LQLIRQFLEDFRRGNIRLSLAGNCHRAAKAKNEKISSNTGLLLEKNWLKQGQNLPTQGNIFAVILRNNCNLSRNAPVDRLQGTGGYQNSLAMPLSYMETASTKGKA
jgi:hypothetical protein